jgi:predicted PurR-regulated permease PerM
MSPIASFNTHIKQVIILLLLLLCIFLVLKELYVFFPGLLGALTLYILSRGSFFQLIYHRKWPKGWTAGLYLVSYLALFILLVYLTFSLLGKRIQPFLNDPSSMIDQARLSIQSWQEKTGFSLFSPDAVADFQNRLVDLIPRLLNNSFLLIANLATMLFVLYYMLVHGKEMESFIDKVIPLKQKNIHELAAETKHLVKASALGIPIISIIQGFTATIGYMIFGVNEYMIWGFLTGVFAFFPVVGTMVIWIPLVIFMYGAGESWNASGLFLYSLLITGNIDYLARITLLKKLGHVHPVVTVLGVIAGLGLFGFIGLIFGPLLVTYIILLFRIYSNEFAEKKDFLT